MRRIGLILICLALLTVCVSCGEEPPAETASVGLSFRTNYDGTCAVDGMGECTDTVVTVPATSPAGDKVTAVAGYAFREQSDLTEVILPGSVTSVGPYAFAGCTGLTAITLPDKLTDIDIYAFSRCSSLKQIYLGGSLTEVGDGAFYGCGELKYAFWRGTSAAWAKVSVGQGNSALTMEGTVYLYSATAPTASGYFWYYSNGSIRLWS